MKLRTALMGLDDKSKQELAIFSGSSARSVKEWSIGSTPKGLKLIRAIVFLVIKKDLHIDGYEKDTKHFRAMALLAFDLMTAEELAQSLKFPDCPESYRFMISKRGLSPEREEKLIKILTSFSAQLKAVIGNSASVDDTKNVEGDIITLSSILSRIEPGLDFFLVSEPNVRKAFRESLEEKGFTIFKTSNALHRVTEKLNSLCSEKTLNEKKKR